MIQDQSFPDKSVADQSVADQSVADESVPDESVPDESVPDQSAEDHIFIRGQKYLLRLKNSEDKEFRAIADQCNLSMPIAQVLYNRGYRDSDLVRDFLFGSIDDIPSSGLLKNIDIAADRILRAIKDKEKILIFGDYDVDGISSSALLLISLLPLGADINFFLPNRIHDGYGLSSKIVKKAASNGYKLIITVDNGITAHQPVKDAIKLGVDVVITDHHMPHGELPMATIVNPNQDGCSYPNKYLPGVGVAFKLMCYIYDKKGLKLPDKVYELLMLGTVADVVPLLGENRYWVRHGLNLVNKRNSFSINVLKQNSKLKKSLSSLDIGFSIAPQINAIGRLSDPREGVKFLISSDCKEVERVGKILFEMNESRKLIERQIVDELIGAIESKKINLDKENIIMAACSSWPSGVIGLVAGKIMNQYGKPTFIFHLKDGILKGSCRSIREFNVFNALEECSDLLLSFGGHAFAAGLSLKQENLQEFKERLEYKIKKELTEFDLLQKLDLDANLRLPEINGKLISDLDQLEPFGSENRAPSFFVEDVTLLDYKILKDKHVKCSIFSQGIIKSLIFFNRPELKTVFDNIGDKSFNVAGNVTRNEWNGRVNIELQGLDIAIY